MNMNPPQSKTVKTPANTPVRNAAQDQGEAATNTPLVPQQPGYDGPEQRSESRRQARDRRDCIRYEIKKDDRRADGRRASDQNPWLKYQG